MRRIEPSSLLRNVTVLRAETFRLPED